MSLTTEVAALAAAMGAATALRAKRDLSDVADATFLAKAVAAIPGLRRDYEALMGVGYCDVWLDGSTFSSPASGAFAASLARILYDGTAGTFTVAQEGGPSTVGAGNALRWNQSVAGSGDTYRMIEWRVEDASTFNNDQATLSLYLSAETNCNVTLEVVQHFGSGGSPSADVVCATQAFAVTSTVALKTLTVAMPTTASKVYGSVADDCVKLRIKYPTNAAFDVTFSELRFERGAQRTPFSQVPLALKQTFIDRYLQYTRSSLHAVAAGAGAYAYQNIPYKCEMRDTPTVTFTQGYGGARTNLATNPTAEVITKYGGTYYITATGAGAFFALAEFVKLDARL